MGEGGEAPLSLRRGEGGGGKPGTPVHDMLPALVRHAAGGWAARAAAARGGGEAGVRPLAAGARQRRRGRSSSSSLPQPAGEEGPAAPVSPELQAELRRRRAQLAALLPPHTLVLLPAAAAQFVPGTQIPRPYRWHSHFLYLTGLREEGSILALQTGGEGAAPVCTLFVPNRDPAKAQWDGHRVAEEEAVLHHAADRAFPMAQFSKTLGKMAAGSQNLAFNLADWARSPMEPVVQSACRARPLDLNNYLSRVRWVKSDYELGEMRASASMAAEGFLECFKISRPGVPEHALAATFEYATKIRGAQRLAYPPVVAAGEDACIIHYSKNDKVARDGDLLLMDAGCEYNGYCSDITRTWPINGKFTGAQAAVYNAVLDAHKACIEACVPGSSLRQLHQLSIAELSKGLHSLGVVPRASEDAIAKGLYRRFYPHSVSHWLGLDTHDVPSVDYSKRMEPGAVLTVEPGLYIPDLPDIPADLRGIGVRIEDDIVVTRGRPENMTAAVPVEAGELEALVGT